ncbi:hypothetical protein D3C81_1167720 [compost metagenome]
MHLGLLHLSVHFVHPRFGLRLAQASTLRDQLCEVGAITFGHCATLCDRLGQDPRRYTVGSIVADRCRAIATEQAVDEIPMGIRLGRHARSSPDRSRTRLHACAGQATDGAHDQQGGNQRGHCPRQEAMGRIAEIHFIAVQIGPLHPQPAGDIAAQA